MSSISTLPGHLRIKEPELLFHADRLQDRDAHPLNGLLRYGPYSRSMMKIVPDPIRVATIFPAQYGPKLRALFNEVERRHVPRERRQYLPDFPGFSRVFGVRVVPASGMTSHIELPVGLDDDLNRSERPHHTLAAAIVSAMNRLTAVRHAFDVLLLVLPDKWESGFWGDDDDFDLHDYVKATAASRGVPSQILREASALTYSCRASVMWRLGIALYSKAGGIPWKIANSDPNTAYIGLSYALRPRTSEYGPAYVTCCSQVFDADGSGLEFVAYETDDVRVIRDDPFLSQTEMRRVMARSLRLYQSRHAGKAPRRVVVHKTTEFKKEEVEGCFDAWTTTEQIQLYQVQQNTLWRGIRIDPPRSGLKSGVAAGYPCERGTYLQLGLREVLVWTQGNAPEPVGGKNYYKEGKGIPHPLLIKRFAGHGGWDDPVRAVLGLTKMNWNNDSLYDRLPVTLSYAATLARTVKRMPEILPRPYEFRLFM